MRRKVRRLLAAAVTTAVWQGLAAFGPQAGAGQAPPPAAAGAEREISTQGVVTLLARRYGWIWEVPPNQLRVQEVRDGGGRARLVWVSRPAGAGQPARHAFALLFRSPDGARDLFVDLTGAIEVGGGEPVLAAVQLAPGETGFVVGIRATASRPQAGLYVVVVPQRSVAAAQAVALQVEGDLVALEPDPGGRLRVRVGRWEPAPATGGVLELPGPGEAIPGGRPVRAVAVTVYTYQPERRAFGAPASTVTLTAFGTAEAFLEAVRQNDMARALGLLSAEWRRVMGVSNPDQLRSYLQASRPGLLEGSGSFRYVGGTVGEEAASVLFSDASGRIYRIRLRAASRAR
ncbi:MAG TPA: hypothetical protein VIL11_03660, partial [Limnochordales bacterium]